MLKGLLTFLLMWMYLPGEPDLGFAHPPASPIVAQLETWRGEFRQALARVSSDLHAHSVRDCAPR